MLRELLLNYNEVRKMKAVIPICHIFCSMCNSAGLRGKLFVLKIYIQSCIQLLLNPTVDWEANSECHFPKHVSKSNIFTLRMIRG